jgi:cytochrome c oxidase subunit 2
MPRRNSLLLWISRLIPAAILLFIVSACSSSDPQSTFFPSGPVADQQLSLFWLIFWLAVAVFIVVEGILLYSIWRFRRRAGQDHLPPQIHGNTKMEIAWTIAPVFILIAIAVPTYITIADQNSPPEGDALHVDVIAHQWWWEFQYPDQGFVTANEMHIPVDTTVTYSLFSQDVIHSFWVPKLAGKIDVQPAQVNEGWFVAEETGTFFALCAELCGLAHAKMLFRVTSQPQADFDRWIEEQQKPPAATTTDLEATGSILFATKQCVLCHTNTGPDAPGVQAGRQVVFESGGNAFAAPNLTHFASRETFAGSILENTDEHLRNWLRDPEGEKTGNRMAELAAVYNDPDMRLTDNEIEALVAYLRSRT